MSVSPADRAVVERYFDAMRAGASAESELIALFTDDAVYIEPFTGDTRTHVGRDAIRETFRASWVDAPPDMTLTVHRIDLDGAELRSEWTCASPVFPAPVKGEDRYVVKDGRIARLEVRLLNGPG